MSYGIFFFEFGFMWRVSPFAAESHVPCLVVGKITRQWQSCKEELYSQWAVYLLYALSICLLDWYNWNNTFCSWTLWYVHVRVFGSPSKTSKHDLYPVVFVYLFLATFDKCLEIFNMQWSMLVTLMGKCVQFLFPFFFTKMQLGTLSKC